MFIENIVLGIQTVPDNVLERSVSNAKHWAPKRARSFTICLTHTDYYGNRELQPTGYARADIRYFSTKKEGLVKI